MLHKTLRFLSEQLNTYIDEVKKPGDGIESPYVVMQNISRLDEDALKTTNKLLVTLLNISEESALKNNPDHIKIRGEQAYYGNPPLNLNLFVMVTSFMTNYENALIYLSYAVNFFQGKYNFDLKNSVTEVEGLPDDFCVILDLYSLSFEQLNYVWSTLGGKQHPFVCYKVRLIKMERESTRETRSVIREIQLNDKTI
jgi:hypothetical protein